MRWTRNGGWGQWHKVKVKVKKKKKIRWKPLSCFFNNKLKLKKEFNKKKTMTFFKMIADFLIHPLFFFFNTLQYTFMQHVFEVDIMPYANNVSGFFTTWILYVSIGLLCSTIFVKVNDVLFITNGILESDNSNMKNQ